jgi:hypothetical protein
LGAGASSVAADLLVKRLFPDPLDNQKDEIIPEVPNPFPGLEPIRNPDGSQTFYPPELQRVPDINRDGYYYVMVSLQAMSLDTYVWDVEEFYGRFTGQTYGAQQGSGGGAMMRPPIAIELGPTVVARDKDRNIIGAGPKYLRARALGQTGMGLSHYTIGGGNRIDVEPSNPYNGIRIDTALTGFSIGIWPHWPDQRPTTPTTYGNEPTIVLPTNDKFEPREPDMRCDNCKFNPEVVRRIVEKAIEPTAKNAKRSYLILGGEYWYKGAAPTDDNPRTPSDELDVEKSLKSPTDRLFDADGKSKADSDTSGNLIKLLQKIGACLYYRSGYKDLPGEVPLNLLAFSDEKKPVPIKSALSYQTWMIEQLDTLIGQFPIEIEIEDTDPSKPENQSKKVELFNISEALAEIYALAISGATNADLSINFLMRLAAEVIATKNGVIVAQDYARANAAFLGYKGNPARREIEYAFNPAKLDTLDQLLQNSKGYVQGWEEDDKESVVSFLQRIVFSAGIIKSVFFRDNKRLNELKKELESMLDGNKKIDDTQWENFLEMLNSSGSPFNQVQDNPKPKVDKQVNYKPATGEAGISGGVSNP